MEILYYVIGYFVISMMIVITMSAINSFYSDGYFNYFTDNDLIITFLFWIGIVPLFACMNFSIMMGRAIGKCIKYVIENGEQNK